jgi:hypothetical protein
MKTSVAFSSLRSATIAELQLELRWTCIPQFQAESEDINRQYAERMAEADACEDPLRAEAIRAVAKASLQARRMAIVANRNKFIADLQSKLRDKLADHIKQWNGQPITETEERHGKSVTVTKVLFPDKTKASLPSKLFVDYSAFDFGVIPDLKMIEVPEDATELEIQAIAAAA